MGILYLLLICLLILIKFNHFVPYMCMDILILRAKIILCVYLFLGACQRANGDQKGGMETDLIPSLT